MLILSQKKNKSLKKKNKEHLKKELYPCEFNCCIGQAFILKLGIRRRNYLCLVVDQDTKLPWKNIQ